MADWGNSIISKITSSGSISTLAGSAGVTGTADGIGSNARFNQPTGVAIDGNGVIYVADRGNATIRKITPNGVVTTLAGTAGVLGGLDGTGSGAQFCWPTGIAVDGNSNVYVTDQGMDRIKKITPGGVVTTLAGSDSGVVGWFDGTGSDAGFAWPTGIAVDGNDNVYVTDELSNTIRKISSDGVVTTVAGIPDAGGSVDGSVSDALFYYPSGMTVDKMGNIYVADLNNDSIRKITSDGNVSTLAGSPIQEGNVDGNGVIARFSAPFGITIDPNGNLYVTDQNNHALRKITFKPMTNPVVTTGTAHSVSINSEMIDGIVNPNGLSTTVQFEYGLTHLYGAKVPLSLVSGSTPQNVSTTLSGLQVDTVYHYRICATNANGMAMGNDATFTSSGPLVTTDLPGDLTLTTATLSGLINPNGWATTAQFQYGLTTLYGGTATVTLSPNNGSTTQNVSVTVAGLQPGAIYHYCLTASNSIGSATGIDVRFVMPGMVVSTFAGSPGLNGITDATGLAARFDFPCGITLDGNDNIYVADSSNATIRKITPTGMVSTLAGKAGVTGTSDGTGMEAQFNYPGKIAVDGNGNIYVADTNNHTIRKINSVGTVSTLAGSPGQSGSTDGIGRSALFNRPEGVAVDGNGNIYVADTLNATIRKITPAGTVSTLAGMAGIPGSSDGIGMATQFNYPEGIAVDGKGNIYVADTNNHTIRKISSNKMVTTLAGTARVQGSSDGNGSEARFFLPTGIAVDGNGNIYVADMWNSTIRKITPTGSVSTLAGMAGVTGSSDGTGIKAEFNYPGDITVDGYGNIYVADTENHTIRKTQSNSTSPMVALNGDNPLTIEVGSTYTDPGALAWDSTGRPLTPVLVTSIVASNSLGIYNVKWAATDGLGVTETAIRTVNVVDTTPPTITTPSSITVNATSLAGASVPFSTSAVDIVSGLVSTFSIPSAGSIFSIGTTTVVTTASDTAGNLALKTFNITVTVPPVGAKESIAPQIGVSGNTINLTVKASVPRRNYQLQYSTNLLNGNWQDIGPVQIGTGSDLILSTHWNPLTPCCFYRLKLN